MRTLNSQLRKLTTRLGGREDMIAAMALAVLAVGSLSFTLITHTGTPAGAALAYMAAVDRADAEYVWSHSIVNALNGSAPTATFLDRAALDAQLKSTAHSRSAIAVQTVNYVSEGTRAVVTYNTSSGPAKTSLIMRGGAPHSWPVLVHAAGLDIALPPGAAALAIDGRTVETNGKELKLAVFPGIHAITLGASQIYESYSGQIDAEAGWPALTPVSFANVRLTEAGSIQAKQAVMQAFQLCVKSKSLAPAGCPQALPETDLATGGVRWILLGDPTADSKVGLDEQSVLDVSGHFVMKLSYGSQVLHRDRLLGVGSSYIAGLAWDGQTFKLSSFRDASAVADLGRPAVTDSQVLGALKAQFSSCLAIQVAELPGCPQSVFALFASKFVWHETSHPAQGATPAWDGKRSLFTVAGSYAFSVEYNSTPPHTPTQRIHDSASGAFTADLYWDGAKVVFIGLEK
jgi:hypothetical protein